MKKNIFQLTLFVALIVGAYAANVSAQIAGGYSDTEVTSAEAKRAAMIAVRSRASRTHTTVTLLKINKAETQVVAGLNYRICMRVREGKRVKTVTAVVYQNLKNKYSLTNWKAGGCTDL
jgi:hypothetical protein